MIERNPHGDYPSIDKSAYIHSSAVIIGKVCIGKNVFIGPQTVIRADELDSFITIGDNCNIQDRVVIHSLARSLVKVGNNTSLSHGCLIHGPCNIGKNCFIGFGSVIFDATLANDIFVQFLTVISGVSIPRKRIIFNRQVIDTVPKVKKLKIRSKAMSSFAQKVVATNLLLLNGYKNIS